MRGPHDADTIRELESAGAAGTRQHHHGIAHADGKVRALAGFARELFEDRRRQTDHFNFIEGAGGEREQGAADAIAFRILHLPHVAERYHRLHEMKGGRVVKTDALAQFGEPNAVAIAGNLFHDRKGALKRLHAAALARLLIDVAGTRQADSRRPRARYPLLGSRAHIPPPRSLSHRRSPATLRPETPDQRARCWRSHAARPAAGK